MSRYFGRWKLILTALVTETLVSLQSFICSQESEVPDYASVKDVEEVRRKANRHSTIPEITGNYTENVVMRAAIKDTPRSAK